jgi:hypothetical protein
MDTNIKEYSRVAIGVYRTTKYISTCFFNAIPSTLTLSFKRFFPDKILKVHSHHKAVLLQEVQWQ